MGETERAVKIGCPYCGAGVEKLRWRGMEKCRVYYYIEVDEENRIAEANTLDEIVEGDGDTEFENIICLACRNIISEETDIIIELTTDELKARDFTQVESEGQLGLFKSEESEESGKNE